jgi:putative membrane protein
LCKKFVFWIRKVNYANLCRTTFLLLFILVFLFNGLIGVFICFSAFLIGLIPNLVGIKRSHCMGVLILPTILYFAGI